MVLLCKILWQVTSQFKVLPLQSNTTYFSEALPPNPLSQAGAWERDPRGSASSLGLKSGSFHSFTDIHN